MNQYAERNHRALGEYYLRHVDAMTAEALHDKSAIAAELAIRDQRIRALEDMLFRAGAMTVAPCFCCGYDGPGYYDPAKHPCAERHHFLLMRGTFE
jgi:hypothetical protein